MTDNKIAIVCGTPIFHPKYEIKGITFKTVKIIKKLAKNVITTFFVENSIAQELITKYA